MIDIILGDNLEELHKIDTESIDLVYIDPPFNTGKKREKSTIEINEVEYIDLSVPRSIEIKLRNGFNNKTYSYTELSKMAYQDKFDNYSIFLSSRLMEIHRILKSTGSLYLHLDQREVFNAKFMLDIIFGEENFQNEIIWAYDYGGRSDKRWYKKHDNILFYSKTKDYYFNLEECDRIPYLSPELVGKEKAERGKFPTDVFWISIVGTNSYEKTGYPTQKPEKLLERFISVSSKPNDLVLDCFAGSGTVGAICKKLERNCILIDSNPEAIEIMKERLL